MILIALFPLITLAVASLACADAVNPSFPVTRTEANRQLAIAARAPKPLERPLVILGGFADLGIGPMLLEAGLRPYVSGKTIIIVFFDCTDLAQCRRRIAERLDRELGVLDATQTVEVDVIGQSLGGLIGVHAALDDPTLPGKRLNVRRLFTISSPLQGSRLAQLTPFDVFPIQRDARPGSALYQRLAREPIRYEMHSYTRLDDTTVGERFASLPGRGVWWVNNPPFERAHIGVSRDSRVLLDIVRRLRGEPPVTTNPPAPLPGRR